jgi:hypothetical protein
VTKPHDPIVAADFEVPTSLVGDGFVLEPLGPQHNERDYAAWTSSFAHIEGTPGFAGWGWPTEMTLEENLKDLEMHERHFGERYGFTYTVLSPDGSDVIGCLYIYGPKREGYDVDVRSWVRADHADLDKPLHDAVLAWIATDWPFIAPDYADRP